MVNPVSPENLESALLITVPSAEPVVAAYRSRFDSSARDGVPAHITVLFPFLAPAAIDAAVHAELTRLFATVAGFSFVLDHAGWFADRVLWLGPRDQAPFRALTRLVFGAFPEYPPYGGQFADVIPHLTVADSGPSAELRLADEAILARLPIEGEATEVVLMTGPAGGQWSTAAVFPLGRKP
jgi:2'-5' RNA ligase